MRVVVEPAINVYALEEFRARLRCVRDVAPIVQVDVVDGIFARPANVSDPRAAARELRPGQLHVHLMVRDVRDALSAWAAVRPRRITIHVESSGDIPAALQRIGEAGAERGLALGPASSLDLLTQFTSVVDFLLFVSVPPGRSGQAFVPSTFDRVRAIRRRWPNIPVGVDGGVRRELLLPLARAGVSSISVGSVLFESSDPRATLLEFQQVVAQAMTASSV